MRYDWESAVARKLLQTISADFSEGNIRVIGVAVWNTETGEGAMMDLPALELSRPRSVEVADVLKDVLGDLQNRYFAAVEDIFCGEEQNKPET